MKKTTILSLLLMSTIVSNADEIQWSGIAWESRDGFGGPGPNSWDSKNVWVDKNGWLHLSIKETATGWSCAQVTSKNRMGFGKYSFEVEGPIGNIDPNVVLGLFMYPPSDVGEDGTNEIDIEFAKWGNRAGDPINYTVCNRERIDRRHRTFPADSNLHHGKFSFEWRPESVRFESTLLGQNWAAKNEIAKKPQNLMINLWLFRGLAPTNGKTSEFVIKSLIYSK